MCLPYDQPFWFFICSFQLCIEPWLLNGLKSFTVLGIGSGSAPLAQCVEQALRPGRAQQWRRCKHLIIDEISMVDYTYFDKLEAVARAVRKKEIPFGGIQLILSGDFLQLPPVTKEPRTKKFCFQVKSQITDSLLHWSWSTLTWNVLIQRKYA